jgi:ring-1,2-phenylacetyl-CoA epoxidase subunit PaaE
MMREMYGLKVVEKKDEAKEAVTLVFDVSDKSLEGRFNFKAGQFVGITHNIKNEVVHRSYSISSDPHTNDRLAVSIKKVHEGRMSTFLVDQVKVGDELMVTPPAGHFYKEPESKRHHVMFAAGSGVTPMMSIIHHLSLKKPDDSVTLFYWNQSFDSSMFKKELEDLAQTKKNFNLFLAFTKEKLEVDEESNIFSLERVSDENLKTCYYNWSTTIDMPLFYLCGPEAYMNTVESFLSRKGYDEVQIRKESFLIGVKPTKSENVTHGSDADELLVGVTENVKSSRGGTCIATFDDEKVEVVAKKDETILEALLGAGETPPYSCMEGTCMACQCKVVEGVLKCRQKVFYLMKRSMNETCFRVRPMLDQVF